LLQVDGIRYTEASTSAFLSQLFIIVLPIAVFGRQHRWPPPRFLAAAALVLAGVLVLAKLDWGVFRAGRGEVETVISTAFFAVQILLLEHRAFRANRPAPVTLVMFAVSATAFFVMAAVLAPDRAALVSPWCSPSWVGFTAALAVVCTYGALTLMNIWQPCISAAEAGLIYAAEPIFASAMALFLPAWFSEWAGLLYDNESLTWRLLLGGSLITGANFIVQLGPPTAPPPTDRAVPGK
jgi:drug/metabolite transporter (DMT)-like permease